MASIIPIGDRWRATVRVKDGGKLIFNRSRSFDTKREADAWATKLEAEILNKGVDSVTGAIKAQGQLVRDLIKRYQDEFDKEPKPFGDTKKSVYKLLAESTLGDVVASRLTSSDVIEWCRTRQEEYHLAPATLYQYLTYFRLPLRIARPAWGMTTIDCAAVDDAMNVLSGHGLVAQGEERDRRLEGDEYQRILEKLTKYQERKRNKTRHADVFRFAVATGFRQGEILRILWEDVDHATRTVIIRDRKDPRKKRGNHQRVPLLGEAWDIVISQGIKERGRIFPYNGTTISMTFAQAVDALNIVDLTFHDMRHEGTSRLFEAGYDIPEVALVTGHKNWNTLRRYTKLRPESLHRENQINNKDD